MNLSVIFLVNLFFLSFCLTNKSNYFDGVIDKLLQLNQAAGKDNNEVGILLSQVSNAFADSHAKFENFHAGQKDRCDSGSKLLEDFIKKLEGDKAALVATANRAVESNKVIEVQKTKHNEQLESTKKDLVELKHKITLEVQTINESGSEAEQKLTVIKTLRDIITDELLNSPQQHSFIQLETFNTKLKELKAILNNSHSMYTALVNTLVQLAETKGFSDQKILGQILEVLKKLENDLTQFRHRQDTEGKNNIKNLKDQAREKVKQLKSISKMLAEADSQFKDNEEVARTAKSDEESLNKDLARKQGELKYWRDVCNNEEELNKRQVQNREHEVEKFRQASALN